MTIKVSIIIPAYNTEKYIAECLQSAINQTLVDIEIIAINDGSTDSTGDIIDSFKAKDTRIIAITQENQGLSRSRNKGADLATGEYLYFLDSDDFISPYAMEILYENISQSDSDLIYGDSIRFFDWDIRFDGLLKSEKAPRQQNFKATSYDPIAFVCLSGLYTVNVWRFMIRKKYWDNLPFQFIEGYHHEDCEFSNKMILLTREITYVNYVFHYYRQRKDSFSYALIDEKTITSAVSVVRSLHDFYEHQPFTTDEKMCYSTLISPDILRAVSFYNLYDRYFDKFLEDEIGHTFFHLKASIRLKHRVMYYLIRLNIKLASSFLRLKYSFPIFKMQFKSFIYNK